MSDGTAVTVQTQRDATTDPLKLRDAVPVDPGTTDPVQTRLTITGDGAVSTATGTPVATDGGTVPLVWAIHVWTGGIVSAGLVGLLMSYVVIPTPDSISPASGAS